MTKISPRFYQTAGNGALVLCNTPFYSGFTTRKGGVSAKNFKSFNLYSGRGDEKSNVERNWERFRKYTGYKGTIIIPQQIHSPDITSVDELKITDNRMIVPECDGIFFSRNDIMAGVMLADCLPIIMWGGGYRAVIHAGWRGLTAGIITNTFLTFKRAGIASRNISAWLGPAIAGESYEVGKEVIEAFTQAGMGDAVTDLNTRSTVSLRRGAEIALDSEGCRNVYFNRYDTFRQKDLFYSYRRDGSECGEMFMFCCGEEK